MQCFYHPGRDVVGTCVNCGQYICIECKTVLHGKVYCNTCVNKMLPDTLADSSPENTSGQGRSARIPPEIRGWNWGAFFLTWIWGISNGVWISLLALLPSVSFIMTFALGTEENEWAWWVTLLSFLPFVGFAMAFVLGAKGNEWAWANKRWDNVQHFQRTQRMWTWWGLGITIVGMVLMGLIMGLGVE